jgi:hypothetical protein
VYGDATSHRGPDLDSLQSALDDPPTLDALTFIAQGIAQNYGARVIGELRSIGSNAVRITLSAKVGGGKPGPIDVKIDGDLAKAAGLKGAWADAVEAAVATTFPKG